MTEKACKKCNRIVEGDVCPICGDSSLSEEWRGYVIIIDPETSQIAEKMGVETSGRYALRAK
ncbi:DNA-directed RNA polymerase subunit E'' [candidate division MSBL1 archaeon SCGC-AAA382A13]|uniref:Transcription elongation factor Spt4 n=1 Tax=candidate division MSBL1 archaeon SCGC-AAA382A13 TaxID=1698279 RepID=A0A133VEV1_9EURY|nr:DNA-directed RNA polymerase subunit E'' [candidate division MSBL1 archaeon SCGC-AAA382A13]